MLLNCNGYNQLYPLILETIIRRYPGNISWAELNYVTKSRGYITESAEPNLKRLVSVMLVFMTSIFVLGPDVLLSLFIIIFLHVFYCKWLSNASWKKKRGIESLVCGSVYHPPWHALRWALQGTRAWRRLSPTTHMFMSCFPMMLWVRRLAWGLKISKEGKILCRYWVVTQLQRNEAP